ncbi:MAG: SAM-dependent methyltransferase [Anaerolineae bacterium]|jgi:23S rRNA (cytosine1962-C5)-methyltransferase|nr:SAM-dependent methyltransferase [Anaerolineae bacterium]MBT3712806.1 SAM-dependent methyltransferase [Anaerolineae bacterium]MBT4310297.1 SAM-dependent methyltransferase [Anaerolineae bacterium]MBT4459776.1 SAM-dependent methyltransferase [Anaerolineae bacterium]MBT4840949.1 SAM-dependent methyltransferase [Anaerolineae bacterium]
MPSSFLPSLKKALTARAALLDEKHQSAFRLFNGFLEGDPDIAIDLYARTIVIHNYADSPAEGEEIAQIAKGFLLKEFPWIKAVLLKTRKGKTPQEKNGVLLYGEKTDDRIREYGVWYALDLTMNRDASLYLDTRNLRKWAIDNLAGKRVLNTFAYTGSLGVAAQAGGATKVVQADLSRKFLNVGKTSYTLNGFPINKKDFQTGDFWAYSNKLKRADELFDCVFLDPPFFADTKRGRVDLSKNSARLINKVRPLIDNEGYLVAINNALFLNGGEYMQTLENLCKDGYLEIERLIPVPEDFTGYAKTQVGEQPIDPNPFNHSTKIAILKVRRK